MASQVVQDTGSSQAHAEHVQIQLQAAFGSAFTIWRPSDNGWASLDGGVGDASHAAPSELVAYFEQLSSEAPNSPRIVTLATGETYACANCREDADHPLVVSGRIDLDAQRLASSLAQGAMRQATQQIDSRAQQELIDCYATRLSESLEELTFLRRLSRHIELCDARRSLAEVAQAILPQLRGLLGVEGICLIAAESDPRTGRTWPGQVMQASGMLAGTSDYWIGAIEEMGIAAMQVLVKNYFGVVDLGPPPIRTLRSMVLAPLANNGVVFGWLLGINKCLPDENVGAPYRSLGEDQIGSIEASLLEAAALMLASHAANCRLLHEKDSLVVDVIHTLVGVIEAKDAYTCGHSDRVALIARRLGEELGLELGECDDLFLSGLLHDIGKIGISDDILLKPGQLTEQEFAQVKLHPVTGARLLQGLRPLEKLIPGVLHHHEAVDGSGYPHGLQGEQIPHMARILAVADAFDAMTSDRPYRSGLPVAKAESILSNGAGKQWDAEVVKAILEIHADIADIRIQWQYHLENMLNVRAQSKLGSEVVGTASMLTALAATKGFMEMSSCDVAWSGN